jgi:eukaryotic-like serine/threonine-protein kinase
VSQTNEKPAVSVPPPVGSKKKDAAVPPPSVDISLGSTPSGAKVQIDGKGETAWNTPFTTKLVPGQHTITFTKTGYVGETKTVAIAAGKPARVETKLSESLLSAALNSDPAGATIEVDGKATGKVTPSTFSLQKGDHTFVFRKDGFQELSKKVTLKEGDSFTFSGSLKPIQKDSGNIFKKLFGGDKVSLQVSSTPKGAEIYVEGNYVNKKTPSKISLPPGDHEIQLKLDGYTTVTRKVTVQKDTPLTIDETLKK